MKKFIVLLIAVAVLVLSAVLYSRFSPVDEGINEETPVIEPVMLPVVVEDEQLTLALSETGYFFTYGIAVEITASNPSACIYYTLDGSVPTTLSARYTGPLYIGAAAETQAMVLRAVAVYDDSVSRPLTHTFFMGADVENRFGRDVLVFSLAADPYDLFDHYTGILVPGFLREEFIRLNPRRDIIPTDPANYNWRGREGERPVNVEVFTPAGERVIAQRAGIRPHGAWSRDNAQLSLRLIPRREYEPEAGRFHYAFFPCDVIQDGSGRPITRYENLILRNGGNDRHFGMLRNEVGSVLARQLGLHVVTPVRPAAVYLNGEYWGFSWLQVRICEQYLQDMWRAPTREFDVVGQGELWLDTDDPDILAALRYKNAFADQDLLDDEVFARLEAVVDIEDMLRYYAFKIYMGAEDWPHNNLRRWRYTGEQAEGLPPELDGRWRYVVVDLDWTLGLYGTNENLPTFWRVLEERNDQGALLRSVLKRPEMRMRFIEIMYQVAEVVNADNVHHVIMKLFEQAAPEIDYAIHARKYDHWISRRTVGDNHNDMIRFAAGRRRVIISSMQRLFG